MAKNTPYITLGQAAQISGWSKSRLSKALKSGEISHVGKDGAGYRLDPAEVLRVFPKKRHERKNAQSETPSKTPENSGLNTELEALREQVKTASLERERERALLNQQIESLRERHREQIDLYRDRLERADREKDQLTALLADHRERRPWWKLFGG